MHFVIGCVRAYAIVCLYVCVYGVCVGASSNFVLSKPLADYPGTDFSHATGSRL